MAAIGVAVTGAISAHVIDASTLPHWVASVAVLLTVIGTACAGYFARDHSTSDEAAGAHQASGTTSGVPVSGQGGFTLLNFVFMLGAVSLLLIVLTGCLAPGAKLTGDPIIIRAEQTESIAYSTFDMALKIDDANRDFWKTNAPDLHKFAEYLRQPVPVTNKTIPADGRPTTIPRGASFVLSLDTVKLAYKQGKATSNEVVTVLATVESAVTQSQKLIAQSGQAPASH